MRYAFKFLALAEKAVISATERIIANLKKWLIVVGLKIIE
jgi:hypothetical protein